MCVLVCLAEAPELFFRGDIWGQRVVAGVEVWQAYLAAGVGGGGWFPAAGAVVPNLTIIVGALPLEGVAGDAVFDAGGVAEAHGEGREGRLACALPAEALPDPRGVAVGCARVSGAVLEHAGADAVGGLVVSGATGWGWEVGGELWGFEHLAGVFHPAGVHGRPAHGSRGDVLGDERGLTGQAGWNGGLCGGGRLGNSPNVVAGGHSAGFHVLAVWGGGVFVGVSGKHQNNCAREGGEGEQGEEQFSGCVRAGVEHCHCNSCCQQTKLAVFIRVRI